MTKGGPDSFVYADMVISTIVFAYLIYAYIKSPALRRWVQILGEAKMLKVIFGGKK